MKRRLWSVVFVCVTNRLLVILISPYLPLRLFQTPKQTLNLFTCDDKGMGYVRMSFNEVLNYLCSFWPLK